MNYLLAFVVGGAICVVGQLLIDLTKLTPAKILVIFVVAALCCPLWEYGNLLWILQEQAHRCLYWDSDTFLQRAWNSRGRRTVLPAYSRAVSPPAAAVSVPALSLVFLPLC